MSNLAVVLRCRAPPICAVALLSGKKKEHKDYNFLGPETARWVGGLPRQGVVAEKFVRSLESLSSLGFVERNLGCPREFCRDVGPLGVFKKFVQKVRAHFLFPISGKNRCWGPREVHDDLYGPLVPRNAFF